jgi:hypothetical protein
MGDLWLLVRVVKRAPDGESKWFVELVFEGAKLEPIGQSVVWSGDEPVADMFVRLASTLKQTRSWPGDDAFRPGKLLHDVASDLGKIVDLHTGPHGDHQVSMIIEVVGDDWAVTREGLDSLHATDLHVDSGELVGDAKNGAFQRLGQHVLAEGLDEASFRSSFRNAKQVHAALRAESREKFAKFGREI